MRSLRTGVSQPTQSECIQSPPWHRERSTLPAAGWDSGQGPLHSLNTCCLSPAGGSAEHCRGRRRTRPVRAACPVRCPSSDPGLCAGAADGCSGTWDEGAQLSGGCVLPLGILPQSWRHRRGNRSHRGCRSRAPRCFALAGHSRHGTRLRLQGRGTRGLLPTCPLLPWANMGRASPEGLPVGAMSAVHLPEGWASSLELLPPARTPRSEKCGADPAQHVTPEPEVPGRGSSPSQLPRGRNRSRGCFALGENSGPCREGSSPDRWEQGRPVRSLRALPAPGEPVLHPTRGSAERGLRPGHRDLSGRAAARAGAAPRAARGVRRPPLPPLLLRATRCWGRAS